jgi:hypothetical protein
MANIIVFWPYPVEQENLASSLSDLGHDVLMCGSYRRFREIFENLASIEDLPEIDLVITLMQVEDEIEGNHIRKLRREDIFKEKFTETPVLGTSSFEYSRKETAPLGIDFVWAPIFHDRLPELVGLFVQEVPGKKGAVAIYEPGADFMPTSPASPIRGVPFRTFPRNTNSAG